MKPSEELSYSPLLASREGLSFSGKIARLADRLKQPEWRRYCKLLFLGKFLGIAAVFAIMLAVEIVPHMLGGETAHAQDAAAAAATPASTTPPNDPYSLDVAKPGSIVMPLNTL